MKIIPAGYEIMFIDLNNPTTVQDIYKCLETAGRICYKSTSPMTIETSEKFIRDRIAEGHDAMLEHAKLSVCFTIDRGVSHELVRHRIASFMQESTRYCNYSKDKFGNEITVIEPVWFKDIPKKRKTAIINLLNGIIDYNDEPFNTFEPLEQQFYYWYRSCYIAEQAYFAMLNEGCTPQEARSVLPNSLKTELLVTANMREWRHIFKLRAAGETGKPHPQMLEVMKMLLNELREKLPVIFDDIKPMED